MIGGLHTQGKDDLQRRTVQVKFSKDLILLEVGSFFSLI